MLNSKNLLSYLLTLLLSFALTACPDDCETDDAGVDEETEEAGGASEECEDDSGVDGGNDTAGTDTDPGGAETGGTDGGAETGGTETAGDFSYVIIQDDSIDTNNDGTPGADICEVTVTCAGEDLSPSDYDSDMGTSEPCDGDNGDNCVCEGTEIVEPTCTSGNDRYDVNVVSDGFSCGEDNGVSPYMSLGKGGVAIFDYGQDLTGCTVTVEEAEGSDVEGYIVAVCNTGDINMGVELLAGEDCAAIQSASDGGSSSFVVGE